MIVFSNYLKILKKYSGLIIMYLGIFIIFSIIFTIYNKENNVFTPQKPNIAIINNENTKLMVSFIKYLEKNSNIKEIEYEDLKDALFFRKVDLILTFPTNFTENYLNGKTPKIDMQRIPDSYNSEYALMNLNRYLNIANLYNENGISEENLIKNIEIDLKLETEVILTQKNMKNLFVANYFYNFSNYSIIAITVMVIGLVMSSFKNNVLKRRNIISPVPYSKQNSQLFLANFIVTLGIWFIFIILGLCFFTTSMLSINGFLLMINLLVFSITVLSIGFLIGNTIYNKETINSIVNVLALGLSFICGAFVPQELLGDSVLKIAKIFPSYWFIKNNNDIVILNNLDFSSLKPILINMFIILLFGLLFYIINKVILKFKIKEN